MSRQNQRARTRVECRSAAWHAGSADQRLVTFWLHTLLPATGVDTMNLRPCMLNKVRQFVLATCCCLWAGLPAPEASAQVRNSGWLAPDGSFFDTSAWSIPGGAAGPGLPAHRWVCHPGWGACVGGRELRLILERQHRFDALRNEAPPAQIPLARGLWRVPPLAYLPPPTPLDQIVPAYRDHSLLRPEFQDSGKPLD